MSRLFFIFLFICLLSPVSWIYAQHVNAYPDIPYQGKRVFVQTIKMGGTKKNGQSFQAVLINTGKSPVTNQDFKEHTVLIKTNPSVQELLADYEIADLYLALGSKGLKLAAGTTNNKYSGWITKSNSAEVIDQKPIAQTAPVKEKEKPVEEKVDDQKEKVAKVKKKKEKKKKQPAKVTKKEADKSSEEVITSEQIEVEKIEAEKIEAVVPEETPEVITSNPVVDTEEEISEKVSEEEPEPQALEEGCSDIQIEKIEILRKSKNSVTLGYTLINLGQAPARLNGLNKGDDNLALRAHLCSTNKLTRGAITLGGSFLKISEENAMLKSGATYTGELKLPLYKLTKFTPFLVLQVDPYQKITECDETNNINYINLIPTEESENN